jgi:lipoate-protein ligase A
MLVHSLYKGAKGLLRVEAELEAGVLTKVRITGDFFMVPEEALPRLESKLNGVKLDRDSVLKAVSAFYKSGVETPMLSKEDIVNAVLGVKDGS